MKNIFGPAVLLLVGLITVCSAQAVAASQTPAVEIDVRKTLERFSELSSRGDVQLFLAQFDPEADIMMVGSASTEVFRGRAALEPWLTQVFSEVRISFQMDRVDINSNGETAWAFAEGLETVRDLAGKLVSVKPYRFSAVLVKKGDVWMWRLFHGSVPEKE